MTTTDSVPVNPHPVIAEPISQPILLSVEEQTKIRDAIVRVWSTDETCYDEKKKFWFVHFPASTNEDEDDELDHWYYVENDNIQITPVGNDTLMIMNPYIFVTDEVWPDVSGLNCVKHTVVN